MKYSMIITAAISLAALPTFAADNVNPRRGAQDNPTRAERREARQDIEKLIQDMNSLDNQPAARRAGIAEAAKQAAVTPARLEAPNKEQPRGVAALFLAQEIAKNTKKSPQDVFKARAAAPSWTQVARDNQQDLAVLEQKLTRIHEAMLDPSGDLARARDRAAAADRDRNLQQSTTTANTAGVDSSFDKSIQSVNTLGQEQEAKRLGLGAIARETDLSRQQVEQAAEQHKQMGLGDLFVAQQLSVKTKKSITELWNMHLSPKSWAEIAQANNENPAQLERQLARVEDAMRGRTARADDIERVRERDRDRDRSQRRTDSRIDSARAFNEPAFQQSIQSVNALGQNANARPVGLQALSRETAMPLSQVEQAHRQHPDIGMGDLFVAQALAAKTKKSVDEMWKLHLNQRTWAQVASDHNQDIGEIQQKLARIEQSMRDAGN